VVNPPQENYHFKAAVDLPDSDFDQWELERGVKEEERAADEREAKEIAKDRLAEDPHYYSKRTKDGEVSHKDKGAAPPAETVESYQNRTTKDFTHKRDDLDYDYTGKKPGYLSMDLPREDISKSARTIEDLMDIETIFPKDFNPNWLPGKPSHGPHVKHRNERDAPGDPMQADDIQQKTVQPLIPNQKLAIAVDPKGAPGNRITILSPLFPEVSPAIQALRSQRFEKHGAVVVDGPPMWLMTMGPLLEVMDRGNTHETPQSLLQGIAELASRKGLTLDYSQMPKAG
jgi:hypothetical protein